MYWFFREKGVGWFNYFYNVIEICICRVFKFIMMDIEKGFKIIFYEIN